MNHASFREVFVTNNPSLLKSGFSEDLAVGQLGLFEADPEKDAVAIAAPLYPANKVFRLIQGTPEVPVNLLGAIANETKKSKPIKGKKILDWKGRAAQRGQNQIVALGYAGDGDTTRTISARCEEDKMVFVKLSGGPIDQVFHTEGKGYVRQYSLFSGCCDDCGDNCAEVSAVAMAEDLARQFNEDPILGLGTRTGNKLARARVVVNTAAPTPDDNCTQYLLSVCDEGNDTALGRVQTQAANATVRRLSRKESISTYEVILNAADPAPAAFSNAGISIIVDCPTCPAGYTLVENAFVYELVRTDAGDGLALSQVYDDFNLVSPSTVSRLNYQFGQSRYIIVTDAEISLGTGTNEVQSLIATGGTAGDFTLNFDGQVTAAIAYNATAAQVQTALEALSNVNPGDIVAAGGPLPDSAVTLTFGGQYAATEVPALVVVDNITDGTATITTPTPGVAPLAGVLTELSSSARNSCVITTPTTIAWTAGETLDVFNREFRITIKDNVCGVSRLEELQAAYPDLVISEVSAGECIRTFGAEVPSNCVPQGCPADVPVWVTPEAFEGIQWLPQPLDASAATAVGVLFESVYEDIITDECAYSYWSYDAEPLIIEISQHSQDYNDKPTICADEWPTTEVQAAKLPIGVGSRVREEEAWFKGYERKYRDENPIVRRYQDSILQTDPKAYYDQYTLAYEFDYHQSWFSEKNTDSYRLEVYFPEGEGKEYEAAINAYVTSVGVDLEPVVL
jgi:hypothetical protein